MYIKRQVEEEIKKNLFKDKVVIVYGARQVGKTTLVRKIANDLGKPYKYLNCDEMDVLGRFQEAKNSLALKQIVGDNGLVIIDEAQRVKNIGLKLKLLVDNYPNIQLLVTGSSSFDLSNEVNEPLTGRSDEYWLFPLSVKELWKGSDKIDRDRQLDNWLVYGSYPDVWTVEDIEEKEKKVKLLAGNYLYKEDRKSVV